MSWPLVASGMVVSRRRETRSSVAMSDGAVVGNQRVDGRGSLLVGQRLRDGLDALGLLRGPFCSVWQARVGRRRVGLLLLVGELVGLLLRLRLRLTCSGLLLAARPRAAPAARSAAAAAAAASLLTDRVEVLLVRLRGLAELGGDQERPVGALPEALVDQVVGLASGRVGRLCPESSWPRRIDSVGIESASRIASTPTITGQR